MRFHLNECLQLVHVVARTDYAEVDELEEAKRHPESQYFSLSTIIAATDNFSPINKLGQGGFGIVYKVNPNSVVLHILQLNDFF
ncbi:hypothetical protein C1H46_012865 [Malus baccata]|uniref:Protein kinase domain-containing protein n=1 Tax=Malus baccata TaxID=106549 RepID=A0A540MRU4_MALBA|nr:hypothetical protein C1H46_012865 [Malus baccata]